MSLNSKEVNEWELPEELAEFINSKVKQIMGVVTLPRVLFVFVLGSFAINLLSLLAGSPD